MTEPTVRQLECLAAYMLTGDRLLAAERLDIAIGTLREHLRKLYGRLGVTNGIDAARKLGWLTIPESLS
jgi:DNA-binding CsgD family transcriptional regulator